jgi:hypothetical protein
MIDLSEAAKWDRGESHQLAAWNWLQEQLTDQQLAEFAVMFRAGPVPPASRPTNPLSPVPYFSQLDNGPQGWRQCQTSSIAMALAYLKTPGIVDDMDYLRVVQQFGDTTVQASHAQALKRLNVRARFRQDMSPDMIMGEIRAGYPVAAGILHHGPATAPRGGGHYVLVHGFTANSWIVHDPYGELDLVAGGWVRQGGLHGMGLAYSFQNFNRRWAPEGPGSGWGWVFS